eukprot:bmy_21257T0
MEERGELSLTGAKQNTGVWLVKVPKYLSQQWAKGPGRGEVGKLRIAKNQGRMEVSFTLNEALANIHDIGGKSGSGSAPRVHIFVLQSVGGHTLTVSTESSSDKLSLEGIVLLRNININLKDLVDITKQPVSYLKEILKEIGIQNVKGIHKNTWELKPEYRHYQGGEKSSRLPTFMLPSLYIESYTRELDMAKISSVISNKEERYTYLASPEVILQHGKCTNVIASRGKDERYVEGGRRWMGSRSMRNEVWEVFSGKIKIITRPSESCFIATGRNDQNGTLFMREQLVGPFQFYSCTNSFFKGQFWAMYTNFYNNSFPQSLNDLPSKENYKEEILKKETHIHSQPARQSGNMKDFVVLGIVQGKSQRWKDLHASKSPSSELFFRLHPVLPLFVPNDKVLAPLLQLLMRSGTASIAGPYLH